MVDLGTLGGSASVALAVNASGQVVGWSPIAGDGFDTQHAFSWTTQGGMVDLGTLGGAKSSATAVNDKGQVVGVSDLAGNAEMHATLWQT
jgi:probable HAF family extracellular repeat protein